MYLINCEEKLNFVKENYHNLGAKEVAKILNCSRATILKMAKKLKLNTSLPFMKRQISSSTQLKNNPLYDKMYNLNDRELTYILGFLWADGHVHTSENGTSGHSIICAISIKDYKHIRKSFLKKAPWKEKFFNQKLKNKIFKMYKINIYNKKLVKWLESLEFTQKSIVFPFKLINSLNKECLSSFIAGYFDGDGSFYFNPKGVYRTTIACNYNSDSYSWIDFFLKNEIICHERKIISKKGHKSLSLDICDIKSNKKFIEKFITPNRDLILPRKMINFDKFLNHTFGRKDWSKIPRRKIKLINNSEELKFNSSFDAAKYLNVKRASVSSALYKGHRCKGFKVEYI